MEPEDKIFRYKSFSIDKLSAYGFVKDCGGYSCRTEIMNGDFLAVITVGDDMTVSGKLIDVMNDEEYTRFRSENAGTYVASVRAAYEELLLEIASECCTEKLFASPQSNRIAENIFRIYGVRPDFPWGDRTGGVFRHKGSRKWFGLIMNIKYSQLMKNTDNRKLDVINLKAGENHTSDSGIYPAYHMNHKNWISVLLDDTVPDEKIMELIGESYKLTNKKGRDKK